ncbi:MAG: hypothetical protein AB3N14_19370 [Flavobacteriaceae bacterium]
MLLITVLLPFSCVQETHMKVVTFKVDTTKIENPSGIGLRGAFTEPPWGVTLPMTDDNEDGIYEITVRKKSAQNGVDFKFVIENDILELEGKNNRRIHFKYKPENITYSANFDEEEGIQEITK